MACADPPCSAVSALVRGFPALTQALDPDLAYVAPVTRNDALALLARPGARALAGGQSLIAGLRRSPGTVRLLVDLGRVEELQTLAAGPHGALIGAGVTLARLASDPALARWPVLALAIGHVANAVIRRRSTLGGNLSHADPSGELALVLAALGARIRVEGPGGARVLPAEGFVTGPNTTVLGPGDLIVAAELPAPDGDGFGFHELGPRPSGGRAVAAALVRRSGTVARAWLGGLGTPVTAEVAHGDADRADAWAEAIPDHGCADPWRRHVAAVLAARAARDAGA